MVDSLYVENWWPSLSGNSSVNSICWVLGRIRASQANSSKISRFIFLNNLRTENHWGDGFVRISITGVTKCESIALFLIESHFLLYICTS